MISAQDIAEVIAPLNEEARSLVIDFARLLRDRDSLMIPAGVTLDGPAFDRWKAAVQTHARDVLAEHRARLTSAGLPPDGTLPASQWPKDMAPASKTSVET
ncbi:MAG TPA: hypothetical protein VGP07_25025 [Polyangia bacterium]|jgi:hypothetical protein